MRIPRDFIAAFEALSSKPKGWAPDTKAEKAAVVVARYQDNEDALGYETCLRMLENLGYRATTADDMLFYKL